jgi:hypothetical protein
MNSLPGRTVAFDMGMDDERKGTEGETHEENKRSACNATD